MIRIDKGKCMQTASHFDIITVWVSVLSVIGVIYYGFVVYLICAIIQNPRGLN